MIVVELNDQEMQLAQNIAEVRSKKDNSRKFSDHSEYNIHLMANVAELCFSKVTGLKWQDDVRPGGDGGVDFELGNRVIQIKTRDCSKRPRPDLLVRTDYAKADYYILSTWHADHPNKIKFIGYVDQNVLERKVTNLGYGDRYIVTRDLFDEWNNIQIFFDAIEEWMNRNRSKLTQSN
jgi:hypothetical protein